MHKCSTSDRNHLSRWTVGTCFVRTSGNEGFRCSACRFLLPVTSLTSTTNCTLSRGEAGFVLLCGMNTVSLTAGWIVLPHAKQKTDLAKANNDFNSNPKASQEVSTYLQCRGHADYLESLVVYEVHSEVPRQPLWVLEQFTPAGTTPQCLHWSARTLPEACCSMATLPLASSSHSDPTQNLCS